MNKFKRKIAQIQASGEDIDELFEEFGIMMGVDVADWELTDFDNMNDQIAHMKQARERQIAYSSFQKRLEQKFKAEQAKNRLLGRSTQGK